MSLATRPNAGLTLSDGLAGPGIMLLIIASAVPAFWFGLESLGVVWATPEYSHGPLIPIISAYLFLHDMRNVPPTTVTDQDRVRGIWVVLLSFVVALFGNLAQIADIVTYGLILWCMGLVLLFCGWKRGRFLWPGVLHLVFMLPLPAMIYWKLSTFLQLISSQIGVFVIRLMDIPVFLDGNVIDLGLYQLQVAEACSGLRYLFPIMSFSYIFALLYTGPRWHKLFLLLSAAPITVLMNSFRIGMIGILVNHFGIGQAEGFLHLFEGWVIFVSCIGALILISLALRYFFPSRKQVENNDPSLNLDFQGTLPQLRRLLDIRFSVPLAATVGITVMVSAATLSLPYVMTASKVERDPFAIYPAQVDTWRGTRKFLAPEIDQVLAADDYLAMDFWTPGHKAPVNLFVAYYDNLTSSGGGIHSPEVCIPSAGWEMSKITQKPIRLSALGSEPLYVNHAIIERGLDRQLVYYWFDQRGRRMTNDYYAKGMAILDSITRGRSDGALVRLVTPIGTNEKVTDAEQRLDDYLEDSFALLPRFVPE